MRDCGGDISGEQGKGALPGMHACVIRSHVRAMCDAHLLVRLLEGVVGKMSRLTFIGKQREGKVRCSSAHESWLGQPELYIRQRRTCM